MSHMDFNFDTSPYPQTSKNYLYMTIPITATHIKLHFLKFNIGVNTTNQCEEAPVDVEYADKFVIFSGYMDDVYRCAGGAYPPKNQTLDLHADLLIVQLVTQSSTGYNGFLIHYQCEYQKGHAHRYVCTSTV